PDGLTWQPTGQLAIDHAVAEETSLARAWVVPTAQGYQAWYGYAHGPGNYRIGYATSTDGTHWQRRDDLAGIHLSPTGWDSQMIGYPAIVQNAGRWFMFYNGNRFGKDGIGLAVAEAID